MTKFVVELEECAIYRYEIDAASFDHAVNLARERRNRATDKDKAFVAWVFREILPEKEKPSDPNTNSR